MSDELELSKLYIMLDEDEVLVLCEVLENAETHIDFSGYDTAQSTMTIGTFTDILAGLTKKMDSIASKMLEAIFQNIEAADALADRDDKLEVLRGNSPEIRKEVSA